MTLFWAIFLALDLQAMDVLCGSGLPELRYANNDWSTALQPEFVESFCITWRINDLGIGVPKTINVTLGPR